MDDLMGSRTFEEMKSEMAGRHQTCWTVQYNAVNVTASWPGNAAYSVIPVGYDLRRVITKVNSCGLLATMYILSN